MTTKRHPKIEPPKIAFVMAAVQSCSQAKTALTQLRRDDPRSSSFGKTMLVDFSEGENALSPKSLKALEVEVIKLPPMTEGLRAREAFLWALQNVDAKFEWLCFCEDDIKFRERFSGYLRECVNELLAKEPPDSIIALYSPHDTQHAPHLDKGRYYVSYAPGQFFGTQCLLVPRVCFADILQFIQRHGMDPSEPLDGLLNLYCRTTHHLYATKVSLIQHHHKGAVGVGGGHQSPSFSKVWMPGPALAKHFQRLAMKAAYSRKFPKKIGHQRGIVICAGGPRYFACAWVCIRMLRHLGCELPIEVWHLGPAEMSPHMRSLLEPWGVRCVDAFEIRKKHPVRLLAGWELKCYSILYSDFEEVLLLDADNVPVHNPTFLFDTEEYQEQGAVFWPDLGCTAEDRDIWNLTGVPYRKEREFESGQVLVHKRRCWNALVLAMHYNEHSDFYYQHVYGDKDTFRFAFRKLGKDYAMPDRGIKHIEGTLCQHDFEGRRLFQHRIKKWSLTQRKDTHDFQYEAECYSFLDELKGLLRKKFTAPQTSRTKLNGHRKAKTVTLRAPVGCSTGYELHARQIFFDLKKLGYHLQVVSTAIVEQYAPVPQEIRRALFPETHQVDWELLLHPPFYKPVKGRKTVYFTMWEASVLPPKAVKNLNLSEAVIVPCRWNAECFRESGVKVPIHVIPLGIKTDIFTNSDMEMGGPCIFGAAGRSDSDPSRKGFNNVIPLFLRAFPHEKDVKLKIKLFPHCKIDAVNDPRIEIERSYLTEPQLAAWFQSLTCFVSMSRSEGWGLMQHQALATGRPVIGTIYGGMAEFFDERMGYPVDYQLVSARGKFRGCGEWAEPSDDDVIENMRQVYRDRQEARRRGQVGAKEVARLSWMNSHTKLAQLLHELNFLSAPAL